MDIALLIPIFGILLTMIPVAGLTLVLTIRLAVKPLVETLADALRDSRASDEVVGLNETVRLLTEEVESLATEVRELRGAQEFDRELLADPSKSGEGIRRP